MTERMTENHNRLLERQRATLRVLVTDPIDGICPALLTEAGFDVSLRTGGVGEWAADLDQYDGWIIRSGTKIDAEF